MLNALLNYILKKQLDVTIFRKNKYFMFNYTAICRQCREYLVNVIASVADSEDISEHAQTSEDVSEPAQIPEATCSQTGEQEYALQEESGKWPQEEVTSF